MIAAALGSAYLSYEGSQQAAGAATAADTRNIAFQQQMFQLQDPFSASGSRAQYVPQLNQLMKGGYAGLQNDPFYQQLQSMGMQGTQRAMASQGLGMSTADLLAINQNQTGTAMNYFNQQYARLADLSGATGGRTAPIQGMGAGTAYDISMGTARNRAAAFGGTMGTLGNIYGQGAGGGSVTTDYSMPMTSTTYAPGQGPIARP